MRGKTVLENFKNMRNDGNSVGAVLYAVCSMLRSRRPVRINLANRQVLIRPNTFDLHVAKTCFAGELSAAIRAATPLKYNFIIDAGGYIGTSAIAFAEAFPRATIVTLEPSSRNFSVLKRNVKPYPNIVPLNHALSDRDGWTWLNDTGKREWGFSIVSNPGHTDHHVPMEQCWQTNGTALLRKFNARGIDILKLDIEGGEKEVLQHGNDWIPCVRVITAELHDRITQGCTAAFEQATYGWHECERTYEKITRKQPVC